MNILHILGNGFDLNLGLNTGYKDFYKYYITIENDDQRVKDLKENIKLNSDNWSDLELALGNYSEHCTEDDFEFIYIDLVDNLCEFLEEQYSNFETSYINSDRIQSDLIRSYDYLEHKDKMVIKDFIFNNKANTGVVDVITLNYTSSLEHIYKIKNILNTPITTDRKTYSFNTINHIHGLTDNNVVLGVNDNSQIINIGFHNNETIKEMFIKKECNNASKHGIDEHCYNLINKADLICIFGSSLGLTDKYLWELVGAQLYRDFKLIIFQYWPENSNRYAHIKGRSRKTLLSSFLKLANIEKNDYVEVSDKIHIVFGGKIFDTKIKMNSL